MDRKIILLGDIGDKFGKEWSGSVDTITDAFKLIECQTKGFKEYIIRALESGLDAAIMVGSEVIEDGIALGSISKDDIIIALIPAGSRSGFGKILAAIAIAVFAFYLGPTVFAATVSGPTVIGGGIGVIGATTQATLYAVAANLALAGVSELLVKTPRTKDAEAAGNVFGGPSNTIKQGKPLPLLYGQLLVGGSPISIQFTTGVVQEVGPGRSTNTGSTTGAGGGNVGGEVTVSTDSQSNPKGGGGNRTSLKIQ